MKSKGKKFENIIYQKFRETRHVSIDRFKDPAPGMKGVANISDFVAYKYPYQYYFECKTTHTNTLNFRAAISEHQWTGLLEKSKIYGVLAGILVWFVEHDLTVFVNIQYLEELRNLGIKSFNVKVAKKIIKYEKDFDNRAVVELTGKKKRIYFDYDAKYFFEQLAVVQPN